MVLRQMDDFDPWAGEGSAREGYLTVSEARDAFLASKAHLQPNTRRNYASYVNQWMGALPVDLMLRDVTPERVRPYVWGQVPKPRPTKQKKGGPRPVKQANALRARARHLAAFFTWAVAAGQMETNPLDAVELPREEKKLATFLTAEDVERIRRAIQADYDLKRAEGKAAEGEILWLADVVTFAVATGLRREEICALRWDAVNLSHRFITVGKAERTKGRHQRPVPLAPPAYEILARLQERDPSGTGYVFRGVKGGKISGDYLGKRFKEVARLAKLPEDVSFHSLRHTCASWLVMKGVPIRVVQEILGHTTSQVTERYSHIAPGAMREAMEQVFASL